MKKGSRKAATDLVRVSRSALAKLRSESRRSGVPLRELVDRAVRAYMQQMPGVA